MRLIHAAGALAIAATLTSPMHFAVAQTADDAATIERAQATFNKGDKTIALGMIEGVLAHSPEDLNALFHAARFNFALGNPDAARGRLERLVKLSGSYFSAWELMVQVTQVQGDLARRDEAIRRLKIAIGSAIDPDIRRRAEFIRDRIKTAAGDVMVADYFGRGGSDFTRYQFVIGDPYMETDKGILLRTDEVTTYNWSQTALMPQDKQLFHLDMVDPSSTGGSKVAIYQYYVGQPDYDTVRALVMLILRGEARPLSGEPGSMQGILKAEK